HQSVREVLEAPGQPHAGARVQRRSGRGPRSGEGGPEGEAARGRGEGAHDVSQERGCGGGSAQGVYARTVGVFRGHQRARQAAPGLDEGAHEAQEVRERGVGRRIGGIPGRVRAAGGRAGKGKEEGEEGREEEGGWRGDAADGGTCAEVEGRGR